jgi:hypothetical protein
MCLVDRRAGIQNYDVQNMKQVRQLRDFDI